MKRNRRIEIDATDKSIELTPQTFCCPNLINPVVSPTSAVLLESLLLCEGLSTFFLRVCHGRTKKANTFREFVVYDTEQAPQKTAILLDVSCTLETFTSQQKYVGFSNENPTFQRNLAPKCCTCGRCIRSMWSCIRDNRGWAQLLNQEPVCHQCYQIIVKSCTSAIGFANFGPVIHRLGPTKTL